MGGDWESFLRFAAFARSKPAFDLEERELPLAAVAEVQRAFTRLGRGKLWLPAMARALSLGRRANVVYPQFSHWFEQWAGDDDGTLDAAVATYSDAGPIAGFEA